MSKVNPQSKVNSSVDGLSKREYFASMAMQGLAMRVPEWERVEDIASKAVQIADALIDELNFEPSEKQTK